MNTPASPKITLAFGHAQLAKSVTKRIRKHFTPDTQHNHRSPVEQSLVVGVFGEWGSGKSSLLHAVKQDFEQQQEETAPVVTVFFNAWRYEKEPHLIVPLLKVVEAAIKRKAAESSQDASSPVWTRFKGTLVKGIKLFRSAALAFASTYEGTVTFKPPGEKEYALKISPKDAIEIFYASQDRNTPSSETSDVAHYAKLDEYDTLYLEFERQLRELTDSDPALNLLFFIDDLDRCLPEKALEMLEAIKLFFDVPRCVFVLAVDDEVVERGVQHRYRDYLFEAGKAASADASHRLPITGAEYLEKIIHLPLRLPPAQTGQAEQFLRERYPELFDHRITHREYQALAPKVQEEEHEAARQRLVCRQAKVEDGHDEPERDEAETTAVRQAKQLLRHAQQQRDLCQLFARAVPPVPRKLQRAAELLPLLAEKYAEKSVELRGCPRTLAILPNIKAATPEDWETEYLAPILAIKVVDSLAEAISHINTHGSHHTDSIVTESYTDAQTFLRAVDSASVIVNASTRFADGFEYGLGAEIGISTDKIHARGPVGLEGLTSQKWIVLGTGQVRG